MNTITQLETLRRKHQKLSREIGSLYDYLDRGSPNEQQQEDTWKPYTDYNLWKKK